VKESGFSATEEGTDKLSKVARLCGMNLPEQTAEVKKVILLSSFHERSCSFSDFESRPLCSSFRKRKRRLLVSKMLARVAYPSVSTLQAQVQDKQRHHHLHLMIISKYDRKSSEILLMTM
jgi:hypothetical protein